MVETYNGEKLDRLSPWATYVVQPSTENDVAFKHKVWNPSEHVSLFNEEFSRFANCFPIFVFIP